MSDGKRHGDIQLQFYEEHPDQAKSKLQIPDRVNLLRASYRTYISERNIGPKGILLDIENRVKHWARSEFIDHTSATLSAANLRDFRNGNSGLVMASRLLLHVYIWTSHAPYREEWGPFHIH